MSDNIKVVVKLRPLISREVEKKLGDCWRVKNNTLIQLDQNGRETDTHYTFDKVYDKDTKTQQVYDDVAKPIVEAAIAGFNGTIFAYGQTSSGKTYTMTGTDESPGIIPLAILNLFDTIKSVPNRDFLVRVSYIEIYNETLKDLLNIEKKKIKIHDTIHGVKVDVTERVTSSPEEVLEAMKEGEANRMTGATNLNDESSRSHSIFQITIESREHVEGDGDGGCVNVSELNLVDLAGSERAGQTGATGIRFKEGTHINKSLSTLALVIKQLSEDPNPNKHVNFRDSKLTRILQNSLGGNAKTNIICAVTPASVEETTSTLQFANRAKAIKNTPAVNVVTTDATMIQTLTKRLSHLQAELASKKYLLETKNTVEQSLQKKIAELQRLILNGFGQHSSMELVGTKRKLVAPRRMTISTLHHIEDEPVSAIPRFRTPCLKYNAMTLPAEFQPIQNSSKLASVPEETRMITPPPTVNQPVIHEEIIELDSDDDDNTSETKECSPYHKCFSSSKTPPCVLRRHAKQAEKNLKDIVELTEREKIYTPSVVELLQKQEQNIALVNKLREEIHALNEKTNEKDKEIDELKNRVDETDSQVKTIAAEKSNLESAFKSKCKDYETQLTDWEVSYETLEKKAKTRERELLSLLEEHVAKIGKPSMNTNKDSINFMDMSKDISLVNMSDTESSVTNENDTPTLVQDVVKDMQSQLATKNQSILELETSISTQRLRIESLENSSQQLQTTIDEFRNKLCTIESENSFLKSNIDSLNSTIQNQKQHLETANKDIKSYNDTIQELLIKLNNNQTKQKEDVMINPKITENLIESMIANEEKFIANNDNIKNIIHSLKIALENKNEEINTLKLSIEASNEISTDNISLKERIEAKDKQISVLIQEAEGLKDQLNENIVVINKLIKVENDLTNQLKAVQEQNETLVKQNMENTKELENLNKLKLESGIRITKLQMNNEDLSRKFAEIQANELAMSDQKRELSKQIDELSKKISDLENNLINKEQIIMSMKYEDKKSQELAARANMLSLKFNNILKKMDCEVEKLPETVQNLEHMLNAIQDKVDIVEAAIAKLSEERDQGIQAVNELKNTLSSSTDIHKAELTNLQAQVNKVKDEFSNRTEELLREVTQVTKELDEARTEIDTKSRYVVDLEEKLNYYKECNESLRKDIASKEKIISELQKEQSYICSEIETLKQNTDLQVESLNINLQEVKSNLEQLINERNSQITSLEYKLSNVTLTIENRYKEVNAALRDTIENRDKLLFDILKKASKLTDSRDIENSLQFDQSSDYVYERIILALDQISNHITLLSTENDVERSDIEELLRKAKKEIEKLTDRNIKLMDNCEKISNENKTLRLEIDRIDNLNKELLGTGELLTQLNTELATKTNEIKLMERKALEWKEKFTLYENAMKQELNNIMSENEKLKDMHERDSRRHSSQSDTSQNSNPQSNIYFEYGYTQSRPSLEQNYDTRSPQSLLAICCNKIINAIQPKDHDFDSLTTSTSKSSMQLSDGQTQTEYQPVMVSILKYENISKELSKAKEEISGLYNIIEQLETANKFLLLEREEVRRELKLLTEPAKELQKKIINHRTALSTLTAMTYAENKQLNSQLKVLKHHHTRYINVCQRDLPAFKTQLNDLMTILKDSSFPADKQNASFKRYSLPDVLDSNTSCSTLKNESTLDCDLLMLDTNVTMATSLDNTLVGHDQTCHEVTLMNFDTGIYQTDDADGRAIDPCFVAQIDTLTKDNVKLFQKYEALKEENTKLKLQIEKTTDETSLCSTTSALPRILKDMQSSPIKINKCDNNTQTSTEPFICQKCTSFRAAEEKLSIEVKELTKKLEETKAQRDEFQQKFNNLSLEVPSIDALTRKLSNIEKDHKNKILEISKLNNELVKKTKMLKELQDENDALSTQVIDNISEADNLKQELEMLKDVNCKLEEKYEDLEKNAKETYKNQIPCVECTNKNELIKSLQSNQEHSKINRSLSDSDSSSRYNTICTLQSELHASKEDCKKITEEVATIKNHLERSNISIGQVMDIDESMGESNIFTFTKDLDTETANKSKTSEVMTKDIYTVDKIDCLKFYVEKTDADKENMDRDFKIIDIMKMLYNSLVAKHVDEIDNLINKLKNYEDLKFALQTQLNKINVEHSEVTKQLEESNIKMKRFTDALNVIQVNTNLIQQEMSNVLEEDKSSELINLFKEKLLTVIDKDLNLSLNNIFESLINNVLTRHQKEISEVVKQYEELQNRLGKVVTEFNIVNDNLKDMKDQLYDKEKEYNLLKAQKEKVHEISSAVTLHLVNKEKELAATIAAGYKRLVDLDIIAPHDTETESMSLSERIKLLFEHFINKGQVVTNATEENHRSVVNDLKSALEEKDRTINALNNELAQNMEDLKIQKIAVKDTIELYEKIVEENRTNSNVIRKINEELDNLKESVVEKETVIKTLEQKISKELIDDPSIKLATVQQELDNLMRVNEMILKEKDNCAAELEKTREIIANNKLEFDKMTADILVLRESVNDNVSIVESLTLEAKSLMEQNTQLKKQFEQKNHDCSRLEMNIKTHEKTAEIQSKMIIRLQKQKEEDAKRIEEVTEKCTDLQSECNALKEELKISKDEIEVLKSKKDTLEAQVAELESECCASHRRRLTAGAGAESTRRRRQSIHDSARAFPLHTNDCDDHSKIEAVFESRPKPDDLFVDEDSSNRSTPIRLSRDRDSLSRRSSDRDEEEGRPSSVARARLRRHSQYDQRRPELAADEPTSPDNPDTTDDRLYPKANEDLSHAKPDILGGNSTECEISKLRDKVSALEQELIELTQANKELDEECETCAQYLRERDEQCSRLKKEKTALERQVAELNDKLKSIQNRSHLDPSFAHASVNTDADWANLHSVVVDRMSFDAEVEKNKKLTRIIEELRCTKQELKNTISKMQRTLEKNAAYRETKELEATKEELSACQSELAELRARYRELDEECDTCAQYLRERDEQCRKLREAKRALEEKLEELQEELGSPAVAALSRRKRHSLHDHNRSPHAQPAPPATQPATTEITDDFLYNQVERDEGSSKDQNVRAHELKRVKNALDKVLKEKAALENQLLTANIPPTNPTLYVATGSAIVQNQQITDIMKENQKLKKINAKLISICKKRDKLNEAKRENEDPSDLG